MNRGRLPEFAKNGGVMFKPCRVCYATARVESLPSV